MFLFFSFQDEEGANVTQKRHDKKTRKKKKLLTVSSERYIMYYRQPIYREKLDYCNISLGTSESYRFTLLCILIFFLHIIGFTTILQKKDQYCKNRMSIVKRFNLINSLLATNTLLITRQLMKWVHKIKNLCIYFQQPRRSK